MSYYSASDIPRTTPLSGRSHLTTTFRFLSLPTLMHRSGYSKTHKLPRPPRRTLNPIHIGSIFHLPLAQADRRPLGSLARVLQGLVGRCLPPKSGTQSVCVLECTAPRAASSRRMPPAEDGDDGSTDDSHTIREHHSTAHDRNDRPSYRFRLFWPSGFLILPIHIHLTYLLLAETFSTWKRSLHS